MEGGQVIATVGDEKIARQMKSLDAQIAGLEAQLAKAQADLSRAESLVERGTIPRVRLDEARTAADVANNALRARVAERSVVEQQLTEGQVLAPTAGRVLKVPYTVGAVVLPGETVATIAEKNFVLRLRVPERHARFLKAGDAVRIDGDEIGQSGARFGKIKLVYPQIEDGQVVADATVDGLGDYFVERAHPSLDIGRRAHGLRRASGLCLHPLRHRLCEAAGGEQGTIDVPVQRGRDHAYRRHAGRHRDPVRPHVPVIGWCGREPRTFRSPDARDDPLAADAAVPAGGASRSA